MTIDRGAYDDLLRRLNAVERDRVQDLTAPARGRVADLRTVDLDTWSMATVLQRYRGPALTGPMRIDTGAGYGGGELCYVKGGQHMSMGCMLSGDDWMFTHALQASTNSVNAQLSGTDLASLRNANMSPEAVVNKLVNPTGPVKARNFKELSMLAVGCVRRHAEWKLVHPDLVLTLQDGFLLRVDDEVSRCGLGDGLKVVPLPVGRDSMWRAIVTFVELGMRAVHNRHTLSEGKSFDATFMFEGGYVWPRDGAEWTSFRARISPRATPVQPAQPPIPQPAAVPGQAGGGGRGRRGGADERPPYAPAAPRYEPYKQRVDVPYAIRQFCKDNDVCTHFQRGPKECKFLPKCRYTHRLVTAEEAAAAMRA